MNWYTTGKLQSRVYEIFFPFVVKHAWKCPPERFASFYQKHLHYGIKNHLEIGTLSMTFPMQCPMLTENKHKENFSIALVDIEKYPVIKATNDLLEIGNMSEEQIHCIECDILNVEPLHFQQCKDRNMLPFDSIAINATLLCIKGSMNDKLDKIIDNLIKVGAIGEDTTFVGGTLTAFDKKDSVSGDSVPLFTKIVLNNLRKYGIFDNANDHLEDLEKHLSNNFSNVEIENIGYYTFFKANKFKSKAKSQCQYNM